MPGKTLEEARNLWLQTQGKFAPRIKTRVVYMGDGRGHAASNLVVPEKPNMVYVREQLGGKHFFPVAKGSVRPAFNLPVLIGRDPYDSSSGEMILREHDAAWEYESSASVIGGLGPHHIQHEWGGGDEVFLHSNQLKPGLAKPTDPPSMQITILSFVYYYNTWQQFSEQNTVDLSIYKPNSAARFVLVAVDPESNRIVYRPGNTTSGQTWASLIDNDGNSPFSTIPAPAGDEIPICAVFLKKNTAKVNWNLNGVYNLFATRMYLGFPMKKVLDRLDQLEGYVGFKPNLATTGAADSSADEFSFIVKGQDF